MANRITISAKVWIVSIFLALTTFFNYFIFHSSDEHGIFSQLMRFCFILFILFAIVLFKNEEVYYQHKWHVVFMIGIVGVNVLFNFFSNDPVFKNLIAEYTSQLSIMGIFLIGFIVVSPKYLLNVLNRYYFFAFIVGILFLVLSMTGMIDRNAILNENTWGLFLAPYFIYIFVKTIGIKKKIMIYIIGVFILFLSDAVTALAAFILLPLFMYIFNIIKRPRILYAFLFLAGLTASIFFAYVNSDLVTDILSKRDILWEAYLDNARESIFMGSGAWKVDDIGYERLEGAGAHNTFISLVNYNGLFVLILYLLFILYGVRKKATYFTVSDGVLFLAVLFQFAETNMPLFSFVFPSVIFLANILINKESEVGDGK